MTRYTFNLLAGIIVLAASIINHAPTAGAAECAGNPVIFLVDVSGSMRCESPVVQTTFESGIGDDGKIEKIELAQELLYRLVPPLAVKKCQTGILLFRYLPGDSNYYSVFMRTDSHGPQAIKKLIKNEFVSNFPVFNRRTPLADTLRNLDKKILEPASGKMTVVLISDGKDSFYDHEKDVSHKGTENKDKVIGPVSEVKRLMNIYGDSLTIHTVYVPNSNNKTEDKGGSTLEMMASAGKGESFTAIELLEEDLQLDKFTGKLCCK